MNTRYVRHCKATKTPARKYCFSLPLWSTNGSMSGPCMSGYTTIRWPGLVQTSLLPIICRCLFLCPSPFERFLLLPKRAAKDAPSRQFDSRSCIARCHEMLMLLLHTERLLVSPFFFQSGPLLCTDRDTMHTLRPMHNPKCTTRIKYACRTDLAAVATRTSILYTYCPPLVCAPLLPAA